MKKFPISVVLTLVICSIIACNKNNGSSPAPIESHAAMIFPAYSKVISGLNVYPTYAPTIPNIWGIFLAERVTGSSFSYQYPTPARSFTQYSDATLPADFASHLPDSVLINNKKLDFNCRYYTDSLDASGHSVIAEFDYYFSNEGYYKDTINLTTDNIWSVNGDTSTPAFTYNYTGPFPSVVDNFPDTIIKSKGASFTFNNSNIINADSVIVSIIYDSTGVCKETGIHSTINFSPEELNTLKPIGSYPIHFCYINLSIYRYTIKVFGRKQFAFVKYNHFIKAIKIID